MLKTLSDIHWQNSKSIQKHSETRINKNMGTTPLMKENQKKANVKYASLSIMIGIPTEEWYDLPFPGIMYCQNSTQKFLQM